MWTVTTGQIHSGHTLTVDLADHNHFFDSFAPTLPLPLRFSILRS
ncbi:hypothetical protein [Anatilimnocola floriformis]|nr:hypothetical protein [Anatilimnocola floriformis]